jgi:hypothetical protein
MVKPTSSASRSGGAVSRSDPEERQILKKQQSAAIIYNTSVSGIRASGARLRVLFNGGGAALAPIHLSVCLETPE